MSSTKESCTIRPELIEFDKQNDHFMTIVSHNDGFKLVETTEPTNMVSDISTFDTNINLADLYINNLNLSGNIYRNGETITDLNIDGVMNENIVDIYNSDNAFKTLVVHNQITMYDHNGSNVCSIMALKNSDEMSILPIIEPDFNGSIEVQFASTISISETNGVNEPININRQTNVDFYNNQSHYYFTVGIGSTIEFVVGNGHKLFKSDTNPNDGTITVNYSNNSLSTVLFDSVGVYGFNCYDTHSSMLLVINVLPTDRTVHHYATMKLNGLTIKEEMRKTVLLVDDVVAQTVTTGSDNRLKKNIEPLTDGLTMIHQMNPITYNWIHDDICDNPEYGFVAQDIEKNFPSLVKTDVESGMKSVDYMKITSMLAAAVQELSREIQTLKDKSS